MTNSSIACQRSPNENPKTLTQFHTKGENTPHDPKQEYYHYSDDESKRQKRNSAYKFPKYKDRKSIFSTIPRKTEHLPKKTRASFTEIAGKVLSSSLQVIEWGNKEKNCEFPKRKPNILIEKIKKNLIEEFRGKRSKTLDMHEAVQEANIDNENSSDSSEERDNFKEINEMQENLNALRSNFNQIRDSKEDFEGISQIGNRDKTKEDLEGISQLENLKGELEKIIAKSKEIIEFSRGKLESPEENEENIEKLAGLAQDAGKFIARKPEIRKKNSLERSLEANPLKEQLHLLGIFALDQVKESKSRENLSKTVRNSNNLNEMLQDSYEKTDSMRLSSKLKLVSGSNSSIEKCLNLTGQMDLVLKDGTPKRDKDDLSIKTDSSSDEYTSTDNQNPSRAEKKPISINNTNTQNSILSFNYTRKLQRKSVSIMGGFGLKIAKRDSISISKKDMTDMNINLEILRLGNAVKINKNRVIYADLLKALTELFIRNHCFCDIAHLRSKNPYFSLFFVIFSFFFVIFV